MSQIQYFLGGNTPSGFYSLYHELSDPHRFQALYILKGGAGCGKSTLMKRVARHAQAAGLDTVAIPCSGDPGSLDGVIVPKLAAAVVDGTAPHVVEAKCPGAVEQYVDLSCFYRREALQPLKEELLAATQDYQGHYKRVYRCLGAAGALRQDVYEALSSPALRQKLSKRAKGISSRELKKDSGGHGLLSQRFLSAVTHRGYLTLWDTVSDQAKRVYVLQDRYGLAHHLLSPILTTALAAGHDAVACPDPMAPDRLAHLILPGLSLAFVTSTPQQPWPGRADRTLRLDALAAGEGQISRPKLRFTLKVTEALQEEAVSGLAQAKQAHDHLERLYNPHVDFDGVYEVADRLADALLHLPPVE